MSWFRKSTSNSTVTCDDVGAAFGALLEHQSTANDKSLLPHEPELIKTALVHVAAANGTEEAIVAAKSRFILLNSYESQVYKLNPVVCSNDVVTAVIDREHDALEREFDQRFALARGTQDA